MNKLSRKKIDRLIYRIDIIEKRIRNLLKQCAMSNNETLGFWIEKQKELKWEYDALKVVFAMIIKYVITKEYWTKYNQEVKRIKNLKSINKNVNKNFSKSLVHTRTIQNIFNNAYNTFVTSIDMGYKKKMSLLNKIQLAVIKVNRVEKAGLNEN